MAMVSNLSLPFPLEIIDGKQRDASFSSFLNAAEENSIRNLVKNEEDGEIGVFRAEKYFNGVMGDEAPLPISISAIKLQLEKITGKLDLESMAKPKIQPGTPSLRSASSWNSQSALMQSVLKIPGKSKRNRGKSFLSLCKCSCCDKTSVDVMKDSGDVKASNPGESPGYELKIIESNLPSKIQIAEEKEEDKKPRKSLEILGNRSLSFQSNKTKIWEESLQEEEFESAVVNGGLYKDASSDCSSDLFEIENLTGKTSHFHGRKNSDSTSCFTQTTCDAPSEVSIEWSVVTAEFSASSDYDSDQKQKPVAVKSGHSVQKRRSGILLGCKNEKAVGVAMDAYRRNEKSGSDGSGRRRSESFPPLTRFEADSKVTGLSWKQKNQALPSLAVAAHPRPLQTQIPNQLEIQ